MIPIRRPAAARPLLPDTFVAVWRAGDEWVAQVEFGLWDEEACEDLSFGRARYRARTRAAALREARRRAETAVRWLRGRLHELEAQVRDKPAQELSEAPYG